MLTTLTRLTNEMNEYQRLTTSLKGDLEMAQAARDSLRDSLFEQTNRLQRVTEALEKAHEDLQSHQRRP